MNVFVCVKQVPDTETKIQMAEGGIQTQGVKWVLNPYDEFAVEEALKFKAANPAAVVTVISLGPKARVVESLRTALAMGADEAALVDAPENTDNFSTAKALTAAIKTIGTPHLVYSGKLAIDDNASAVTQMVAEFLGFPHVLGASKIEYLPEKISVERELEGGAKETLEVRTPCVVSANKGLNTPRYASLPGIMKAKKKVVREFTLAETGVAANDTKVLYSEFRLPPERPPVKILSGDPGLQAGQLVKLLRDEAKVI